MATIVVNCWVSTDGSSQQSVDDITVTCDGGGTNNTLPEKTVSELNGLAHWTWEAAVGEMPPDILCTAVAPGFSEDSAHSASPTVLGGCYTYTLHITLASGMAPP